MPADLIIWFAYLFFLYFVIFWLLVYLDANLNERPVRRKDTPFLSIAIPAYNEEDSIARTIDSVLKLDYPREKFEIMVVNDGSRDNTKEIVEDTIKGNKGFNIILLNQENKGKGEAMNTALEKARGEFFITLDADSFIKSDAANKLLGFFDSEKVAAVLPVIKIASEKGFWSKMQYCEYLINFFLKKLYGDLDCIHVTPGPFS
ncbi:glycosyltransferase family 2 protein, partial [Candidatus Woesearchaeota archaeon]|nr:glycosyltransferase family 2 protein [Candidatus Woesearchaeota archaeon]